MSTSNAFALSICECCGQVISKKGKGTIERHTNTIYRLYGLSLETLKKKSKLAHIVEARQHFWLLLCIENDWSYTRTGNVTGHEYTTVMSGIRKASHRLINTPPKSSIYKITKTYWLLAGLDETEAEKRAQKKAKC